MNTQDILAIDETVLLFVQNTLTGNVLDNTIYILEYFNGIGYHQVEYDIELFMTNSYLYTASDNSLYFNRLIKEHCLKVLGKLGIHIDTMEVAIHTLKDIFYTLTMLDEPNLELAYSVFEELSKDIENELMFSNLVNTITSTNVFDVFEYLEDITDSAIIRIKIIAKAIIYDNEQAEQTKTLVKNIDKIKILNLINTDYQIKPLGLVIFESGQWGGKTFDYYLNQYFTTELEESEVTVIAIAIYSLMLIADIAFADMLNTLNEKVLYNIDDEMRAKKITDSFLSILEKYNRS